MADVNSLRGSPVPYGKACTNCSRAKSRCVTRKIGGECERCHRLRKECQPLATVRKRKVRSTAALKTAELEAKLDGLVNLIKSATHTAPVVAAPRDTFAPEKFLEMAPSLPVIQAASKHSLATNNQFPQPNVHTPATSYTSSACASNPSPESLVTTRLEIPPEEAEECLRGFRDEMLPRFPFMVIPASTTVQQLRQEQPFLWRCIVLVSSKSVALQFALGKETRLLLGQKVLVDGEKNLDLLCGIVTYLGWAHTDLYAMPVMSGMLQLALALVGDLALNKPPLKEPHVMLNFSSQGCPKPYVPTARTLEDTRALMGTFLISSVISSFFQKLDPLRWTPYFEESLQSLSEKQEYPSDMVLVQLVRLQLITNAAGRTQPMWSGQIAQASPNGIPLPFYIQAMRAQLEAFKNQIPNHLQQDRSLLLHLYGVELNVYEIAFAKPLEPSSGLDIQRIECLYLCLNSVKSWFDLFLTLPVTDYIGMSTGIVTQMAHSIIVLYRLSTIEDPGWDRTLVQKTLDFRVVLMQVIENFKQVKEVAGLNQDMVEADSYTKTAQKLSAIISWLDAKVAGDPNHPLAPGVALPSFFENIGDAPVEFLDDAWLKDMLAPWEFPMDQSYAP